MYERSCKYKYTIWILWIIKQETLYFHLSLRSLFPKILKFVWAPITLFPLFCRNNQFPQFYSYLQFHHIWTILTTIYYLMLYIKKPYVTRIILYELFCDFLFLKKPEYYLVNASFFMHVWYSTMWPYHNIWICSYVVSSFLHYNLTTLNITLPTRSWDLPFPVHPLLPPCSPLPTDREWGTRLRIGAAASTEPLKSPMSQGDCLRTPVASWRRPSALGLAEC